LELTIREHIVRIQIIDIRGRLQAASVGALRNEQTRLIDAGNQHFIVDLRETTFMDSAGMSALVSLLKQAKQIGGDVVLVKPTDEAAYRILTLTRFDQVFRMADTVEDALRLF